MSRKQTVAMMSLVLTLALLIPVVFTGCKRDANAKTNVTINGAGATFPFPVYSKWADKYHDVSGGVKMNYQSIGSGGGIKAINDNTVDFGASDAPLTPEELDKGGLMQFPMIIGGVVPVVNLKGVAPGQLKLTPTQLARIYLGEITNWNDADLKTSNPDLALPDLAIIPVNRSDGSGTTWIYTNYLSKVSNDWKTRVGNNKSVSWPAKTAVGGNGNEGVASRVNLAAGSIGYVEYAYVIQNKMNYVQLQNQAGKWVSPTADAFQAAAANADWAHAPGYYMVLTDQPGDASWPIVGASFILLHKKIPAERARTVPACLKFFSWCYTSGQEQAMKLDYVPIPANVVKMVEESWIKDLACDGKPVWPVK
ncbi:MAG: Phosphate-binding protein PstS [Phycisphaerae bacterium]|nr:Phosphate-binding protein PstS [Phycisphaerae bacterium]